MEILLLVLPFILRIANFFMDQAGMKQEEKEKFIKLIVVAKDDSLTPIQRKDEISDLKAKLKARLAAGKEG